MCLVTLKLKTACFYIYDMLQTKDIWEAYAADIKRFILSKVHDVVVADDLLQETFIKVHTKHNQIKDQNKLKAWVFSIARYTVIDYFRNQNRFVAIDDMVVVDDANKGTHTEQDCLRGIIKSLPKKYRTPLFLADIKGLKQVEVADVLHLPLPTVKSQIQRGRKLIAQGFMDCCNMTMNEAGYLVGEVKDKADCKICHH